MQRVLVCHLVSHLTDLLLHVNGLQQHTCTAVKLPDLSNCSYSYLANSKHNNYSRIRLQRHEADCILRIIISECCTNRAL